MKNYLKTGIIGVLLATNVCYAQVKSSAREDYNKFIRVFPSVIYHPVELLRNCTPTACLLKVEVDPLMNIVSMKLSDSAEPYFAAEFEQLKTKLDVKLLERYLKTDYKDTPGKTFVIPLYYSIRKASCAPQVIPVTSLYNYFKFGGDYLKEGVVFLDPIYSNTDWQR